MIKYLFLLVFLFGCGAGEGTNNDKEDDNSESTAGSPTINISGGGENSVTTVNITDSADGQVNESFAENNQQDPTNNEQPYDPELSDFDNACAFCCTDGNDISDASCVDGVEGENNQNGDCSSELLMEAGCSPDPSAPDCFLCKELGL